jgi:hypothetical protein
MCVLKLLSSFLHPLLERLIGALRCFEQASVIDSYRCLSRQPKH